MRSSGRKRYISSIRAYLAISCCASSKGQSFPERTTFAARASSTSMFERRKLFLNPKVRKQHSKKQPGNVRQFNSDFWNFQAVGQSQAIPSFPIKHPLRITSCARSRRQPSPTEQHLLREQGRLRTGILMHESTDRERKTELYEVLLKQ